MYSYTTRIISKKPGYIVKAQIAFVVESDLGNDDDTPEFSGGRNVRIVNEDEALADLRGKLQHIIPGSLHPRYNLTSEGLILMMEADSVAKANANLDKLHDYIQSGAVALNQRAKSR